MKAREKQIEAEGLSKEEIKTGIKAKQERFSEDKKILEKQSISTIEQATSRLNKESNKSNDATASNNVPNLYEVAESKHTEPLSPSHTVATQPTTNPELSFG